jgi:Na+/H+ antiporter NhaD/arsenite permease-like protein
VRNGSACRWIFGLVCAFLVGLFSPVATAAQELQSTAQTSHASTAPITDGAGEASYAHPVPDLIWTLPFVALLLAIAICPLVEKLNHRWESNLVKLLVGLGLSAIVLVHYATRGYGFHGAAPGAETVQSVLRHALLEEYLPFIVLLFSLYVIAGGLRLRGDLLALPTVNTGFLAAGGLMASFIGTTGASMILIRPLLQTNRDRKHVAHTVVFFIFIVSNIGGTLLPIGDPPLFLGYLKGVPFFWTLSLAMPWLVALSALLALYYLWDRLVAFPRESKDILRTELAHRRPLRVDGRINFLWLFGVVAAVVCLVPGRAVWGTTWVVPHYLRELILLSLAILSLVTTPNGLRRDVSFTYTAILEVAALFLGIFLTMQVPIEILQAYGSSLGLTQPLHFFWSTGTLSSFLDNAPTYLVFFETARSMAPPGSSQLVDLSMGEPIAESLLAAISLGAVFMGANTYIGNGPNFMVKSIAESHGVKMPGFFGYMVYSVAILIPLFIAIGWLFLR